MTKPKKPTLKEEFFKTYTKLEQDGRCVFLPETLKYPEELWTFFEPHLRKTSAKEKVVIEVDLAGVKMFNELWPEGKLPTGYYGRCTEKELVSSFTAFFKEYPTYNDWNIILNAAFAYIQEREADKYNYTKRSKYFVRREQKDKSVEFLLAEYYERIANGTQDTPKEKGGFEPRLVE
jgi:hypothetical protein